MPQHINFFALWLDRGISFSHRSQLHSAGFICGALVWFYSSSPFSCKNFSLKRVSLSSFMIACTLPAWLPSYRYGWFCSRPCMLFGCLPLTLKGFGLTDFFSMHLDHCLLSVLLYILALHSWSLTHVGDLALFRVFARFLQLCGRRSCFWVLSSSSHTALLFVAQNWVLWRWAFQRRKFFCSITCY